MDQQSIQKTDGPMDRQSRVWSRVARNEKLKKESTGKRDVIEKGRKEKKVKTREKKNGGR